VDEQAAKRRKRDGEEVSKFRRRHEDGEIENAQRRKDRKQREEGKNQFKLPSQNKKLSKVES